MPKEELRAALEPHKSKIENQKSKIDSLLDYWQQQNRLVIEGATVRLAGFQVELNPRQQSLLERIEQVYIQADIVPPPIEEVSREVKAPPDAIHALLRVGVERGRFLRVQEGVYFHRETVARLQALVRAHIAAHGNITVSAFRDLTTSNRKSSLLVLEFFDQIRFTRRVGDLRVLAASDSISES
jgi:selenocysteine-specific elongation factor